MIKNYFTLFLMLQLGVCTFCQTSVPASTIVTKPVIDSAAIANWVDLSQSEASITADGKYFMYLINNLPVGRNTLAIQSTENSWKREFIEATMGFFSDDNKLVVFKSWDSLYILSLINDKWTVIPNVDSYKTPRSAIGKWLAYLTKNKELILLNLLNRKEQRYQNIAEYQFSDNGKVLLIKSRIKTENITSEDIEWIDLTTNKTYSIWSTPDNTLSVASSFQFDDETKKLVFLVQDKKNNQSKYSIWYYKEGMPKAIEKLTNETPGISKGMIITNSAPSFSKTGNYIFFSEHSTTTPTPRPNLTGVQVDVWNYKDLVLQPLQAYFLKANQKFPEHYIKSEFVAAMAVDANHIQQLENDSIRIAGNTQGIKDFVITSTYGNNGDKTWLRDQKRTFYLTNLKDGTSRYLTTSLMYGATFWFSPNEKYFVYFNPEVRNYISYEILNGTTKYISKTIQVKLTNEEHDERVQHDLLPAGTAGWLENGNLLVYDYRDIWELDPSGTNEPRNLTNDYGRINNIKFDLIPDKERTGVDIIYSANQPLLLSGFYIDTKQNGFFKVAQNTREKPQLLSIHSSLIYATNGISLPIAKAANTDLWIVKKQSFSDAPNFYSTKDFKSFRQLTDVQPQKKYRWGTTELLSWKTYDGKDCKGILYKPEDFDSTKKHPVIVMYYMKESQGLHQFLQPEIPTSLLNVPWCLSRGYFVFKPDIHYTFDKIAESVISSVVPGVRELFKLPYIDSLAIGIHGQSHGGYETNVLATIPNFFAAAAPGAGRSNFISGFGSLLPTSRGYGTGGNQLEKGGEYLMTGTMWENRQAYIDNSPIFKADRVTTPLLIRHNKGDEAVPWGQGVEFFIALRRLDKPVWMLQYDEGGHGNESERDKMDYTIRLTQFFNHFLKGAPAPKWMTQGIPATMKGIEAGYTLEPAGNCGTKENPCKVCRKWNEKWNKDSVAVKQEIKQWEKL
jgi:dipeptidyl aminopeptidase/acylaminoacyl peptidase